MDIGWKLMAAAVLHSRISRGVVPYIAIENAKEVLSAFMDETDLVAQSDTVRIVMNAHDGDVLVDAKVIKESADKLLVEMHHDGQRLRTYCDKHTATYVMPPAESTGD